MKMLPFLGSPSVFFELPGDPTALSVAALMVCSPASVSGVTDVHSRFSWISDARPKISDGVGDGHAELKV